MEEVILHRTGLPRDPNAAIDISCSPAGPSGTSAVYTLRMPALPAGEPQELHLDFCSAAGPGLTNEALLAVVVHRLKRFQAGPYDCPENAEALLKLEEALLVLKNRARHAHRIGQSSTGTERVFIIDDERGQRLVVQAANRDRTEIKVSRLAENWAEWQRLESPLKRLGHLVPEELGLLAQLATTVAAKNGFTELKSALGELARPK